MNPIKQNVVDRIKGLYAIADAKWNPLERLDLLVEKFLEGGCRLVQLRAKPDGKSVRDESHSRQILLDAAHRTMKLKSRYDFTLIVNDFADIAFEAGADGVHVGENDEPVGDIKKRYGDSIFVGFSSHSTEEARAAIIAGADYVAIGAVFPTKTKGPSHPIVGIEALKGLCSSVRVPVVAIGGITPSRAREVAEAGASAFAVITSLSESNDIPAAVRTFL